jgi:ABC-type phosphate transport system auxiliary subunit
MSKSRENSAYKDKMADKNKKMNGIEDQIDKLQENCNTINDLTETIRLKNKKLKITNLTLNLNNTKIHWESDDMSYSEIEEEMKDVVSTKNKGSLVYKIPSGSLQKVHYPYSRVQTFNESKSTIRKLIRQHTK